MKKYDVFFENSSYERRKLNEEPVNYEEGKKIVAQFLKEHHYHSYYWREAVEENENIWFDVGSWSEFFIFSPVGGKIK